MREISRVIRFGQANSLRGRARGLRKSETDIGDEHGSLLLRLLMLVVEAAAYPAWGSEKLLNWHRIIPNSSILLGLAKKNVVEVSAYASALPSC